MKDASLFQARQLSRLREIGFDAAMRALGAAALAMAAAETAVAAALAERNAAARALATARHRLVEKPGDAAMGLARIAVAHDRHTAGISALDGAEQARRTAEDTLIATRAAVRRADARRTAMSDTVTMISRQIRRAADEREAIEIEEGTAAMRNAA